jgi:multicomponent Na+:H+ antiporter subunit E
MIARALSLGWLVAVWVALWESASVANLASGLAVGGLLLLAFPIRTTAPGTGRFRPVAAVRFLGYFLWKLLEANAIVAWEVITPSNAGVKEGIVAVPVTGASDAVVSILANAISLTPGTLTLEVERDPTVLYIHVLHLDTADKARRDVLRLELAVLRAFGTVEAIATAEDRLRACEDVIAADEAGRARS